MPTSSAMLTKKDNEFPKVSKSNKTTTSNEIESSTPKEWTIFHPNIQKSFYQNLKPPTDLDDAHIMCRCHEQAVDDFQLQVEMVDIELAMLCDNGDTLPYNEAKAQELEEKKLKLLSGKRFHMNSRNAYWFYLMKGKN